VAVFATRDIANDGRIVSNNGKLLLLNKKYNKKQTRLD